MQFVVSTGTLLKHLQLISGVISNNNLYPLLQDYLFEIKGKKLVITATDLETTMSTELEIDAKKEGSVAIPSKILLDTLKNLPEQPLTVSVDEESLNVELTSENGKYKLVGDKIEEFPTTPVVENVQNISMSATTLARAINHTIFATSTDELRPAMTGVYFNLSKSGLTLVATDAHKLVRYTRTDVSSEEESNFIVPKKALNLLKNTLVEAQDVQISFNPTNAFFSFGTTTLICRLIDSKFPDYNAVIPEDNPNLLQISRADLHRSLKRIAIYSNQTTHQVHLRIAGSELNISAQDLDYSNEAKEALPCSYEGQDMEIGFNAKFLIEIINIIDSDEVSIKLSEPSRAGLVLPNEQEEGEDVLMLVMPVMIQAPSHA